MDITQKEYLPDWMEFDKAYIFHKEELKKDIKNPIKPYSFILRISEASHLLLVDSKNDNFIVKLDFEEHDQILVFDKIIECWKFYNYGRILYYNSREFFNSLKYDIHVNIRILLDPNRRKLIPNVITLMIDNYNIQYNKMIAQREKTQLEEDRVNFKAITELYEKFMVSYYVLDDYSRYFDNLKEMLERFHMLYFSFMKDSLSNPYTDVD